MGRLPTIKRILREDVREAPSWIEKILYPINTFFEQVYNTLNRNVGFRDNIRCQIKSFSFRTTSAYDGTVANFTTITFLSTIPGSAEGVILLDIKKNTDNFSAIEGDVYLQWQDINGVIEIPLIRGLAASTTYNVKVLVI